MTSDAHAAEGMREALRDAIAHAAHLLPAQAPLARFVHHNTLHAFEDLPFERALVEASEQLGGEPYLTEEEYDDALARGRILAEDIEAALRERCPDDESVAHGLPSRRALRRLRLSAPAPRAAGEAVDWLLSESDLLERWRPEVTGLARERLETEARATGGRPALLRRLWAGCLALAVTASPSVTSTGPRLRDRVLAHTGQDADTLVSPLLIRFLAAYLDQGVAYWPMPERDGLWRSFVRTYRTVRVVPPWFDELRRELDRGHDATSQILRELMLRGIGARSLGAFVHAALQALPGWAGMVHQLAVRPDLAPGEVPPVTLEDYLAIRLILDRLGAVHLAREAGLDVEALLSELSQPMALALDTRALALELFVMAQRAAVVPTALARSAVGARFAAEVRAFDSLERRATFQLAYERRFRVAALDAIAARAASRIADPVEPIAQLVMCIDEREESFRRQLEETDPRVATFGYAGHFEVSMSFVGYGAPRAVALCPPVIVPQHRVREVPLHEGSLGQRRALGRAHHGRHVASRTLVRGGFVALTGILSAVPLVSRTLFPRLADRLVRASRGALATAAPTRLRLTREGGTGPAEDGLYEGYTTAEQAAIVERVLRSIGLTRAFAELVLIAGHGSSSVNNPHASAYACGACAGSTGGPNARAFAAMANDPGVRTLLAERGLPIPTRTTFVGVCHDTATDALEWYDEDLIPARSVPRVDEVKASLARASALDALERCRRFPDAPLGMTPERALEHARARSVDLAQPRPEYCHATNALCVVGRRSLTRALFLDRRAFLVSYDPAEDDAEGRLLERVLAQVVPVGAGINLEYYFSRVDPERYGCGSKLPHNITGLLGVMNGHGSDLRTGLHWQTVELHEPMRLLVVVESTPEVLLAVARRNVALRRLISHRWILLAAVDPSTAATFFLERDGFVPHAPAADLLPRVPSSEAHFRGRRENLPFALVDQPAGEVSR